MNTVMDLGHQTACSAFRTKNSCVFTNYQKFLLNETLLTLIMTAVLKKSLSTEVFRFLLVIFVVVLVYKTMFSNSFQYYISQLIKMLKI